jgi:hypothetical protein
VCLDPFHQKSAARAKKTAISGQKFGKFVSITQQITFLLVTRKLI